MKSVISQAPSARDRCLGLPVLPPGTGDGGGGPRLAVARGWRTTSAEATAGTASGVPSLGPPALGSTATLRAPIPRVVVARLVGHPGDHPAEGRDHGARRRVVAGDDPRDERRTVGVLTLQEQQGLLRSRARPRHLHPDEVGDHDLGRPRRSSVRQIIPQIIRQIIWPIIWPIACHVVWPIACHPGPPVRSAVTWRDATPVLPAVHLIRWAAQVNWDGLRPRTTHPTRLVDPWRTGTSEV